MARLYVMGVQALIGIFIVNLKCCLAVDGAAIEKAAKAKSTDNLKPEIDDRDSYSMGEIPQELQGSPSYKGGNWVWTGPTGDQDTHSDNKRSIGRWKNTNWVQQGRPSNFGVYNYGDDTSKRDAGYGNGVGYFHDLGIGDNVYTLDGELDKRQGGRWNLINRQLQKMGYLKRDDEQVPDEMDKRHGRWNLIHRQLEKMGRLRRDGDAGDDTDGGEAEMEKRMGGRWRLIQNKLQSMQNRNDVNADKRFMGRWKNSNWMLRQALLNAGLAEKPDSLQKRSIGRWKNQNWLLRNIRELHDMEL